MTRRAVWVAVLLLPVSLLAAEGAPQAGDGIEPSAPAAHAPPGVAAAHALSTITGVAISPLLGVSAVGVWTYWKTPAANRARLPWYARPWFWGPALALLAVVFLKDVWGTALPAALKKPFDVAEAFENKISALLVAGLFVPLIASIFGSSAVGNGTWFSAGTGWAAFDPLSLLNLLTVPVAVVAFLAVWLAGHVVNVLILISPWGVIDAVLKLGRLCLAATVALVALANPYAGAAWALVIILVCYLLAGWSFRLMVFGAVFGWDLVTLRCQRFQPDPQANRGFLACAVGNVPVRTLGVLRRDAQGRLSFSYRPWLLLPRREVTLPPGPYVVARGLIFPEIVLAEDPLGRAIVMLPPRFLGHEEAVARIYELAGVRDAGWVKGFSAFRAWLREAVGLSPSPTG